MELEAGRSGHQLCPSCKKFAPHFQRNICASCWTWFEENVDNYYHTESRVNGRLQCPNQTDNCSRMTCPHCQINIFLNITGYTNSCCLCKNCKSRTILEGGECSKCLRQKTSKYLMHLTANLKGIPIQSRRKALDQLRKCYVKLIRTADLSVGKSSTTSVIIFIFLRLIKVDF